MDAKDTGGSCWRNVRLLVVCACIYLFTYALESANVYDMQFIYIIWPLYIGIYILTVYIEVVFCLDARPSRRSSRQAREPCTPPPCTIANAVLSRCLRYRFPRRLSWRAHWRTPGFDSLCCREKIAMHSPALCYACATVRQVLHPRPYF